MKPIVIISGGGFGREVQYLIESINEKDPTWEILGYIDDSKDKGSEVNGHKVLGNIDFFSSFPQKMNVVVAIGNATIRKKIVEKLKGNPALSFPNLIDPSIRISKYINLGEGNIICAGSILTTNIEVGDFNIVNLSCTIGHDANLSSYITLYPGVNISGAVTIGDCCELGTGSQIVQSLTICEGCTIGAGAVVVKGINKRGTYVGIPAALCGEH